MHRALVAVALIGMLVVPRSAAAQVIGAGAGTTGVPSAPGAAQRPGLPARDPRPGPRTGTGRISGRVTIAETGAPARRAQVQVASGNSGPRSTTTDADGSYEIAGLPAGNYLVTASRPGLVAATFGQRLANEPGTPFPLADGQDKTGVHIAIRRGGVIVVRVTDEFGDAISGAQVQVQRYQYGPNGRQLTFANSTGASMTDDLGQTRVFGLAAGEYVVSAAVRNFNVANAPGADDRSDGYPNTYYPGTANPADAETVIVQSGQEASAQFALIAARLARISGRVTDSAGHPAAGAQLSLISPSGGGYSTVGGGQVAADGTFSLIRVPPGNYLLRVMPRPQIDAIRRSVAGAVSEAVVIGSGGIGGVVGSVVTGPVGAISALPVLPGDVESAALPVAVAGDDITGLAIATSRAGIISGRVLFEGASARPAAAQTRVTIQPLEPAMAMIGGPFDPRTNGQVAADGTFQLRAIGGKVVFRAIGGSWALKSVRLGGQDVTDQPLDLSGTDDVNDLQIVMTDRLTEITGSVVDDRGQAADGFTLVALPAAGIDGPAAQRFTRILRVSGSGSIDLRGLPPGYYRIAAFASLESGGEWDPRIRERVRDAGERVTLAEGQKVSVSVRLARAQ